MQVFDAARLVSRRNGRGVIVFMDEIDALGSQRSSNDDRMARRSMPCLRTALFLAANRFLYDHRSRTSGCRPW